VRERTPHTPLALLAAAALLAPLPAAAGGAARPGSGEVILQLEGFGALLNDGVGGSNLTVSAGYGGRAGWRRGAIGFFGEVTCDRWLATEIGQGFAAGVVDFGIGAEMLFAKGRVRVSIAGGGSTLLFDAAFHERGTTGLFVDFRPLALRYPIWPGLTLEVSPIGVALLSPAMGEPHIRRIEYRTAVLLEVAL
jgi:hypothetical protein